MTKRSLTRLVGTSLLLGALAVPAFAGEDCCKVKAAEQPEACCMTKGAKKADCCKVKGVQWIQGYEKGMAEAKSQNKVAVLDFYSTSCAYCRQMDKKTFAHKSVVELSKQFVMVKVNAGEDRRHAIRHDVRGLPTVLMLDADGNEITRIVGYRRPEDFTNDLKEVLAKAKTAKRTAAR